LLCGIGFTMSLFIGGLAFGDGSGRHALVRLGVLGGSVVSALLGTAVLLAAHSRGSHMR
jgi:NhaA family Na+:H+ antiporter